MAGNSQRRGAVRKPGSKKGATVGTGGHGRKALRGKGPTPKAEERTYHPAYKRKAAAEKERTEEARRAARRTATRRNVPQVAADHELIAGRNAAAEAVAAGVALTRVFLVPAAANDERIAGVLRSATALGAPLVEVSRADRDAMTDGAVHQGVAVEVPPHRYVDVEDLLARAERAGRPPLIVALDSVTDPHNLGAVLRSGGAFGAHGVVIPERRSAGVNTTVWKVSAGAAARVPVAQVTNLVRALKDLQRAGCFVVGLDGGGATEVGDLELADGPLVLVTGAEGAGLSRLVRDTCDLVVSVPISAQVESLNAAVATGIALYEVAKKRR